MRTFKDNQGRSWDISITAASLKRVKDLLKIDLIENSTNEKENIFFKVAENPVMLCDIVYVICKPQAEERKITDEQFGEAMGGDAIDEATTAFIEDLIDFFPKAKRPMLRTMTGKMGALTTKAMDYIINRLESPELDSKLTEKLDEMI
jgi:hypothetical protein